MRLFFAVNLPNEVSAGLALLQDQLRSDAAAASLRFVDPAQAHFTLQFLGEQPIEAQAGAVEAAREAASLAHSFELALHGLGVFPDARRPHTLWVGAGRGAQELVALAACLRAGLARRGFELEDRAFLPHLTIARVKGRLRGAAARTLLESSLVSGSAWAVTNFSLMESRTVAGQVKYVALETFRLEDE